MEGIKYMSAVNKSQVQPQALQMCDLADEIDQR